MCYRAVWGECANQREPEGGAATLPPRRPRRDERHAWGQNAPSDSSSATTSATRRAWPRAVEVERPAVVAPRSASRDRRDAFGCVTRVSSRRSSASSAARSPVSSSASCSPRQVTCRASRAHDRDEIHQWSSRCCLKLVLKPPPVRRASRRACVRPPEQRLAFSRSAELLEELRRLDGGLLRHEAA